MPRTRPLVLTAVLVILACGLALNGVPGSGGGVSNRTSVQDPAELSAATLSATPVATASATPGPVSATAPGTAAGTAAGTTTPAASPAGASGSSDCGAANARTAVADGRMDAFGSSAPVTSRTGRLVFANYMPNFPVSIDNLPSSRDYYSRQYVNPEGENGAHAAYGGLIRDRPLTRPPVTAANWRAVDVQREVRQAVACGINGFSVDILQTSGPEHWGQLLTMLKAVPAASKSFKIMLMPDMSVLPDAGPQQLADTLAPLAKYSSAFKLPDGRLVVSPFVAEARTPQWWTQFIAAMEAQGVGVAFVPVFLDVSPWQSYAGISYGMSNWGYRNPQANSLALSAPLAPRNLPKSVHSRGKIWMQPVSVQDERPRVGTYEEAANTGTLRQSWAVAIAAKADWVQLATWNDYGEGTQFAPTVKHGWSFLQISQYYQKWWRTGHAPRAHGDQLFLTYRTQPYAAQPQLPQSILMKWRPGGTAPRDRVEALTILRKPAKVVFHVGGRTYTCSAPAGVHSCSAPLSAGRVSATVSRSGSVLATSSSGPGVTSRPKVQDLQYVSVTGRFS